MPEQSPRPLPPNTYPAWSPRFWHGMRTKAWWRLLKGGRFRVHPTRWPMAAIISCIAPMNDGLAGLQNLFYWKKIARAKLVGPPLFILGHWRSGTTLLHELLIKDDRFGYPTSLQCFAPHHFLITETAFQRFGGWLLPSKRPMDEMDVSWKAPQEDEFALLALGLPSPYQRLAFPEIISPLLEYLDWDGVSWAEQETWLRGLRNFLKAVTVAAPKPLVLKSPTHTGRVALLADAFKGAKFVHITRDPRQLLSSTMRLWKTLEENQSLRGAKHCSNFDYEPYVLECGKRMYQAFHAGRSQVDPAHIIDIRYEDLVADPIGQLQSIYERLDLGDFSAVRSVHEQWAADQHRRYRTNRHQLTLEQESRLQAAWPEYFERYGYRDAPPTQPTQ